MVKILQRMDNKMKKKMRKAKPTGKRIRGRPMENWVSTSRNILKKKKKTWKVGKKLSINKKD